MIPTKLTSDLALFTASVRAASPIRQATPLLTAALVTAGASLVAEIDTDLAGAVGGLDGPDPAGYAGDLVNALLGLATAAYDQASLADMRGTVGRAVFNLGVTGIPAPKARAPVLAAASGAIGEMAIGVGAIGVAPF